MLGLNETVDQLVVANNVCWYVCVLLLRGGIAHILRRVLVIVAEGQSKKVGPKMMWKK